MTIFTPIKIDKKAAINDFCYALLERSNCRCCQLLVWKRLHLFCILFCEHSKSKEHPMPNEVSLMFSTEGLTALAPKNQSKLDDLLARNAERKLSAEESRELDLLLKKIDELNLVKARAAVALRQIRTDEKD